MEICRSKGDVMAKYRNKKVTIGGETYDSKKEAKRHFDLQLLEKAGKITNLQRQVKFELIPAQYETFERYGKKGKRLKDGKRCIEKSVVYIADFAYTTKDGKQVVEDVKGYRKDGAYNIFTIKRKLMLYVHGIKIQEI